MSDLLKTMLGDRGIGAAVPSATTQVPGTVPNNGGGFVRPIDPFDGLMIWAILGVDPSGGYYQSGAEQYAQSFAILDECMQTDPLRVLDLAVEVRQGNLANKSDQAILMLARCLGFKSTDAVQQDRVKRAAYEAMPKIIRFLPDLYLLVSFLRALNFNGRGIRGAVNGWLHSQDPDRLALWAVKYRRRHNWTIGDLYRTYRVEGSGAQGDILRWATGVDHGDLSATPIIEDFEAARADDIKERDLIRIIERGRLPWEAVPNEWLKNPKVLEALMPNMGLQAFVRYLQRFHDAGLLTPLSSTESLVVDRLSAPMAAQKAGLHPFKILVACGALGVLPPAGGQRYRSLYEVDGPTFKSNRVKAALEHLFLDSFNAVDDMGLRTVCAVDVSGSMSGNIRSGGRALPVSHAQVAGVLALVFARSQPQSHVVGFAGELVDLEINAASSLQDVMETVIRSNFGSTNPGAVLEWMDRGGIDADLVVTLTDGEVNAGRNLGLLLDAYRRKLDHPFGFTFSATQVTKFDITAGHPVLDQAVAGFTPDLVSLAVDPVLAYRQIEANF